MVSISWIPLFLYHFMMFYVHEEIFILMFECAYWGFLYIFMESELTCIHSMFDF